eukprot:XP_022262740.1 uncharacterized protein LOC111091371 [Canis lupus familiaris]
MPGTGLSSSLIESSPLNDVGTVVTPRCCHGLPLTCVAPQKAWKVLGEKGGNAAAKPESCLYPQLPRPRQTWAGREQVGLPKALGLSHPIPALKETAPTSFFPARVLPEVPKVTAASASRGRHSLIRPALGDSHLAAVAGGAGPCPAWFEASWEGMGDRDTHLLSHTCICLRGHGYEADPGRPRPRIDGAWFTQERPQACHPDSAHSDGERLS